MLAKKISSLQHPRVKHWVHLRKNSSYREKHQRVLLSQEKVIRELLGRCTAVMSVEPCDLSAQETFWVTEEILKKITGLEEPGKVAAEVFLPQSQDMGGKKWVVILDQIQDPGNLGTLLRSALGLGWDGVILTTGTVDPFNDKALRASSGALFHLPYCWQEPAMISSWLKKSHRTAWVADLKGTPVKEIVVRSPVVLVLSNEGRGLSPWAKMVDQRVCIPLHNQVESLNVASAGAILLHTMRQMR